MREALGDVHPLVAEAETNFGVAVAVTGDLTGARKQWESALARLERGIGDDAPALAVVLLNLADVATETGDTAAGERYLARAQTVSAHAAASPENFHVKIRVANVLRAKGRGAEGLAMLEDLARRAEATFGPRNPTTAHALEDLGASYYEADRYADARAAWEKGLVACKALYGANHPTTLGLAGRIGQAMMMMKDAEAARPLFEHAVLALEARNQPDSSFLAQAYTNLADSLTMLGEGALAVIPAQKGLAIREQRGDDPLQTAEARFVLAQAMWRAKRPAAVEVARKARDEMRELGPRATSLPTVERWLRTPAAR